MNTTMYEMKLIATPMDVSSSINHETKSNASIY